MLHTLLLLGDNRVCDTVSGDIRYPPGDPFPVEWGRTIERRLPTLRVDGLPVHQIRGRPDIVGKRVTSALARPRIPHPESLIRSASRGPRSDPP